MPKIIHCLQDFKENLKNEECKKEVHKVLALAAEDYRFDKEFSDSCEGKVERNPSLPLGFLFVRKALCIQGLIIWSMFRF